MLEKYSEELFELFYPTTDEQLADIFTRGLLKQKFEMLRKALTVKI